MTNPKHEILNSKQIQNFKFEIQNVLKLGFLILVLFSVSMLGFSVFALAAEQTTISPPLITLVPKDLGNNEIWYIGGAASVPQAEVVIYLQGAQGETLSFTAKSNEKGEWFYTHNSFLKEGVYKSWAQLKVGGEFSPPGPEVSFEIVPTALRIGTYRVSYEMLYLALALALLMALIALASFVIYHFRSFRIKNARLHKEIREAEEEARRGLDLLRMDIKDEIEFISKIRKSRELSIEEHRREEKLMHDLDLVERHLLKEISDIEPALS